ncbi:MAG: hypothetical protein K6F73_02030 [Lachnospiraceae bacterium]|nr:hypothetical protein [Lachnospiraceae bacterium]
MNKKSMIKKSIRVCMAGLLAIAFTTSVFATELPATDPLAVMQLPAETDPSLVPLPGAPVPEVPAAVPETPAVPAPEIPVVPVPETPVIPAATEPAAVVTPVPAAPVPEVPAAPDPAVTDPVYLFLAKSAFIGNSVGEGLTMYNNANKKIPLGNATMLTRVCYSFGNDAARNSKYIPRVNGVSMQAKDAVKACGAENVFICMGTNDLVGSSGAENAYKKYQQYLLGIMTENPGVTIFIESCTPSRPGSNVSNEKITAFNAYMRGYCDMFPNMYYVDIATPMMDGTGYLSGSLCSDGSVHLNNKAYEIWANTVKQYIASYLMAKSVARAKEREQEIAETRSRYEKNMKKMEEKKQKLFEERMQAKREAEAAENERRRYELLNVPDEVTLMHSVLAKEDVESLTVFGPKMLLSISEGPSILSDSGK